MKILPYSPGEFYAKLKLLPRMPPDFGSFGGVPERDGEKQKVVDTELASEFLRSDLRWTAAAPIISRVPRESYFLKSMRREDWPASQRAAGLYHFRENRRIEVEARR